MSSKGRLALLMVGALASVLVAFLAYNRSSKTAPEASPVAAGPVTFNRDIAPIVYENCSMCHRPGESGPFSLLTYQDVKGRAALIADVTRLRVMPPWLPDASGPELAGERRLSDQEIALIARWVDEGTLEGDAKDAIRPPQWTEGWQLGEPDLVVEMPEAYTVPAEGTDDFRNFVLPLELSDDRFVRAIEIRPSNARVVHHAVVLVDQTRASRERDAEEPGAGFAGMERGEEIGSPDGQFIGWTPGKVPFLEPESTAWRLPKNSDLVLMLHLVPGGKPEAVTARLGVFFSKTAPTREPVLVRLGSKAIDLPSDKSDYVIEDEMTLPVDSEVVSVYPHAHYLARDMSVSARLPSGTTQSLLHIGSWNFNWQDQYRYAKPLMLPGGTRIQMKFTYDNSSANPRNPNHPPTRVLWGPRSRDEMANVWLQIVPRSPGDRTTLHQVAQRKKFLEEVSGFQHAVRVRPDDAKAQSNLGVALRMMGRADEAEGYLVRAVSLDPRYAAGRYNLGVLLLDKRNLVRAKEEFEAAIRLDPAHRGALMNMGALLLSENQLAAAAEHLARALAIQSDPDAHFNLGNVRLKQGRLREAEAEFTATLAASPTDARARALLASVQLAASRKR